MTLQFQKAVRTQLKARMAIDGPSGAGKTYTSLIAATVFSGDEGHIAVIDTERGSASLYADQFAFDVLELDHFDPMHYVDAIHAAQRAGYDVLIIDSLSHAWEGEGGALDQVDKNAARLKGNSYAAWRTVTPKQRKLVDTMLQSNVHIIATMRSKMEYAIEQDERGKTRIQKVGLAPVQRAGIEYEFTWVIDMDTDHNAIVSKSRANPLADLVENKPGLDFFQKFYDWLVIGEVPLKTKQDLVEFGESIGLGPDKIALALKDASLEWDPDNWAELTNVVTIYSENNVPIEEEISY